MTQKEWREKSEEEYIELAKEISKYITIRQFDRGGSVDIKRTANAAEQTILYNIIYAAMLTYGRRDNANLETILDMAEYIVMKFLNPGDPEIWHVNTYDTIYIPLQKVMGKWS